MDFIFSKHCPSQALQIQTIQSLNENVCVWKREAQARDETRLLRVLSGAFSTPVRMRDALGTVKSALYADERKSDLLFTHVYIKCAAHLTAHVMQCM